jgi:hypothetical protein
MAQDNSEAGNLLSRHARHHRALRRRDEQREKAWNRDAFLSDLHRAARMTEEIKEEPGEAAALNRARQHAKEGRLISQEELDREFEADDE